MRRALLALLICGCGSSSSPATSTFDAGAEAEGPKQAFDASAGPNDALDAAVPQGIACTPGSVRVVAQAPSISEGPVVDDTFAYWLEVETGADASQGYWWGLAGVHRADKAGGSAVRLFGTESPAYAATPIFAADSTSAYWIDDAQGNGFGAVMRGDKDGSSPAPLVSGIPAPRHLELAGSTLFFVSDTSLFSIAVDGSGERMVSQSWKASEWVVGASWIDGVVSGTPVRMARAGGSVQSLLLEPTPGVEYEGLSIGGDGYVYAMALTGDDVFVKSASLVRIPTDVGSPMPMGPPIAQNFPKSVRLFTAKDGACIVYTTPNAVLRMCNDVAQVIGPGPAIAPPVADSTSVYWTASNGSARTVYAWCKT